MRSSRIPHPPGSRFIKFYAWQVKRFGFASAAVLSLLDYFDRMHEHSGQKLATRARIVADLQGIVGRDAVDKALSALEDMRVITRHVSTSPGEKNIKRNVDYGLNLSGITRLLATPEIRNPGNSETSDSRELLISGLESGLIPGLPSIEKEAEKEAAASHLREPISDAAAITQKKRRVVLGVVTWYPEDQIEVERLSKLHGKDEVESAADSIRASGIEPLPGRVAQELQRQASAAKKASAEKKMNHELDERHRRRITADPQATKAGQKIIEKMRLKRIKQNEGGGTMTN